MDLFNIEFIKNIFVIDDGFKKKILFKCDKCIILRYDKNKGKGAVLKIVFEYFKDRFFDRIIFLDGDLKVKKEEL